MTQRYYRMLLRAYPARIRAEFGRDMELAFAALCHEQRGSVFGLLTMCARETLDGLRSALHQRRAAGSASAASGVGGAAPAFDAPPGLPERAVRALSRVAQDVRFALRALRRNPGFAGVAIVTLALGIGVNTAMFSLVDATLLRPLPGVSEPESLVVVYEYTRQRHGTASYPDYRDLRAVDALAGLAASTVVPMVLHHDDSTERLTGQLVSANYFDVLGVRPPLGRGFRAEEEEGFGAHPVVVLSDSLWARRFASDSAVVGSSIRLDGGAFEVVGVAPPGFRGTSLQASPELWVPMVMIGTLTELPFGDEVLDLRGLMMFSMVGRRGAGVSLDAAQAAVDLRATAIEEAAPGMFDRAREFLLMPLDRATFQPTSRGDVTRYTGVLFAVSGGLLLIACINIAGLLSARSAARRGEIAVRLALGAGRARLVQQLMTEGMLLACFGGTGAVAVAFWSLPLLELLRLPSGVDPELAIDGRLLAFNMVLAVATGLIFGMVPALRATGTRIAGALKGAAAGSGRRGKGDAGTLLVVTQVAVTVLLLVGAGLLTRTVINLWSVERGFDADGVLVAAFDLEQAGYDETEGRAFFAEFTDRLGAIGGIRSVAIGSDVPLGGPAGALGLYIDGTDDLELGAVGHSLVGPRYFATLGVPLAAGREFDALDREGAAGVVVINQAMARLVWPGEDALGMQVRLGPDGPASTVVGVVRDYRHASLREQPRPRLYWPIEQQYQFGKGASTRRVLARTEAEPLAMAAAVRTVVRDIDADLPLFGVTTMREQIASTIVEERQSAAIMGVFSLLALLLSAVGLFGVLAYSVNQRSREIGIRCALGASGAQVAARVVRRGVVLAGIGAVLGLVSAAAAGRVLVSWLFDVPPIDAPTFATITVLVLVVAALASFVPARRAAAVDPVVALRGD